jgi:L-amino acid N-acyltransferase YncA
VIIDDVGPDEAEAIAAIYAHHVQHGTASFDTEAPGAAAWSVKISDIKARSWPFLVAKCDDALVGYAYATQFRDRAAYAQTCENSVYVAPDRVGTGVGRALLDALVDNAANAGFRQMIAVIGGGEPASVALHTRAGFAHVGRLKDVGRKFGRLLDTVYMQRAIGVTNEIENR